MLKIVTYKDIIEKYPEVKEDIEALKESKEFAYNAIKFFIFNTGLVCGVIAMYIFMEILK